MTTAVRLPEALEKRLDALAARTHHSKSYYLRCALEQFLEDREDYFLAAARLEDYKKNGEKGIPFEDIVKKMDLNRE
jgi:RHH-type rel operon transcriptional repressor/antitoxin RelB